MSELVTGEAVALDLRTAALPSRIVAAAADAFLQLCVLSGVGLLLLWGEVDLNRARSAALGIGLLVLALIVYPVACETLLRGRTPGKALMGLRVVRDDGGPIGFRQALARGLAGGFLEKPGLTMFVLPVAVSLLNPRGKRVGDLLAGTVVVQERVPVRSGQATGMPPQLAAWASTLELSRLPDGLALSARQFVGRANTLTDAAREDIGGRLVHAVREVTAPPPPPGTPGWAFLAAVLAERSRRETARLRPAGPPPGYPPPGYPPGYPPPGYPPPGYAPATPPGAPPADGGAGAGGNGGFTQPS
ncbi:MAG TPA: RDD family protein [Mycobacteriales bacterium]|jgi:uncharacterized RDD family membrane protein YckC|nr:RDD family protein [Mycobacteriales bacterium]